MTHPSLKSCLNIHTSHNSLVNYTSCVFSVIFADLAQLITVLAIAKTLSPALHHLPTTINTQPPTSLTLPLPPPPCRRQASADVAIRRRRAVALPPPPLTLPLPPHRRQAATDVALSRCRHRRSLRAAATALPPARCRRRAVRRRRASRCRRRITRNLGKKNAAGRYQWA